MTFPSRFAGEGLTFDDVLLVPARSEVLPRDVSLGTLFARGLRLNIPLVSSAMDTVTESAMAVAIARAGGLGIIHKNMPFERQCAEVAAVKAASADAPLAALDGDGRLLAGAAVGVSSDTAARIAALEKAGADVVVIDTAHGHSQGVMEVVKNACNELKNRKIRIAAGNVATGEGARALADAGVDAVKVGVGPGSICTTRIVAGVGMPQLSAILLAGEALRGSGIPVIADGGIRYSGDLVKALAAGASTAMMGSVFAGSFETPGEIIHGEDGDYKIYRGMGSLDAMECGSKDRYFQEGENNVKKLVPEGIVSRVACKSPVAEIIYQMLGGLRSGMGYVGAPDIPSLWEARFVRITAAGMAESHPHDVTMAKDAPNYHR